MRNNPMRNINKKEHKQFRKDRKKARGKKWQAL